MPPTFYGLLYRAAVAPANSNLLLGKIGVGTGESYPGGGTSAVLTDGNLAGSSAFFTTMTYDLGSTMTVQFARALGGGNPSGQMKCELCDDPTFTSNVNQLGTTQNNNGSWMNFSGSATGRYLRFTQVATGISVLELEARLQQ